jgi:hypothetical protein
MPVKTQQVGLSLRTRLASTVIFISLALMGGCAGPQPSHFSPIPPPGLQEKPGYTTIFGPTSGSGSTTVTFDARPGIAVWLGCIGKGTVWTRPFAVVAICGSGNAFVGGLTQPTDYRRGQKVSMLIVGPPTVRWEIRIDGAPW